MDISPMKLHAVPSHSKIVYGKRKIEQVQSKLKKQGETIQKNVAEVINVMPESIKPMQSAVPSDYAELKKKANDFDILVSLMKEKLKISNRQKKIQILTMAPHSWSIQHTANEFQVSEYMVRQERKIAAEKGVFEMPDQKKGKNLSKNIRRRVVDFYCDDEFSRQMPGKKDTVSVKRNILVQKRLLLCNLQELYTIFKGLHQDINIGFSTFCSLRPKWCILVGRSGTHSVCVCTIHQNVELMLSAVKLDKDRNQIIDLMVCDRESKQCMIHRCANCPLEARVEVYLLQQLKSEGEELQDVASNTTEIEEERVEFQQWTTVDRSELVRQSLPVTEFVALVVEKLDNLTAHSYIAKSQAKYLKKCKNDLKENEEYPG
eukprot:Seg4505.3 transcript_id=Seg4505.3/GoldUCD/mRNA.D3Y31 product="hypothetical protein" protein_id=Seg4505.3/GoldUCD/D3Y31